MISHTLFCARVIEIDIFLQFIRPTDSNTDTSEVRIVNNDGTAWTTRILPYRGRSAGFVCSKSLELHCMNPVVQMIVV